MSTYTPFIRPLQQALIVCTWQAGVMLLLLCCLPLYAAQERETGWSNGMDQPSPRWRKLKDSKCGPGHFIDKWRVGWLPGNTASDMPAADVTAVVWVEPRCSDGSNLQVFTGDKNEEFFNLVKKSGVIFPLSGTPAPASLTAPTTPRTSTWRLSCT
jgi:hypothetical protein